MESVPSTVLKSLFFFSFFILIALPSKGQKPVLLHRIDEFFLHHVYAEDNFYYETNSKGHLHGFNLLDKSTFSDSLSGTMMQSIYEQLDKVNNKAIFHNENTYIEEEYSNMFSFDSTGFTALFDVSSEYAAYNAEDYAVVVDNEVFITDGTKEGSFKIMDGPSSGSLYDIGIFCPLNNSIYFEHQNKIHKTDGTREGTKTIFQVPEDILSELSHTFSISLEGEIYYTYKTKSNTFKSLKISAHDDSVEDFAEFDADVDETDDWEIFKIERVAILGDLFLLLIYNWDKNWVIYGQKDGEIKYQLPILSDGTEFVGYFNGKALFFDPENFNSTLKNTLYETDGTFNSTNSIATQVLSTIKPFIHKDILYFAKEDDTHGPELWKYDGNTVSIVDDVIPGERGIKIDGIHSYNNILYFSGKNEETNQYCIYRLAEDHEIVSLGAYADYNNNMVKDEHEHYLNNQHFFEDTRQQHYYTGDSIDQIGLETGRHSLAVMPPKGWRLPEGFKPMEINIPEDHGKTFRFPLIPDSIFTEISATLAHGATRCSFDTDFKLHYRNRGLTVASGEIIFQPDPSFSFISADPPPSSVEKDLLKWEIKDLNPGSAGKISVTYKMPGFEKMGDILSSGIITNFSDNTHSFIHQDTSTFRRILTCSYDPNDIQVNPPGLGDKHLTLKNDELEYFIRFQNTGTDTAFNIVVRDTLSPHLDSESISITGSSHKMLTTLEDNVLSFHFENIQLPDSIRDEPGSHGYILYTIHPKKERADSTIIENQAAIFFDFNPPILTNTVFNTLVEKLPPPPEKNIPQGISFMAYHDLNKNGRKEKGEPFLTEQQYLVTPGHKKIYTLEDSTFVAMSPGNYAISLLPQNGWEFTDKHDLIVNLSEAQHTSISFGLVPDSLFERLEASIASAPINCNGIIPYYIYYKNKGTAEVSGKIKFIPDPRMDFMGASPMVNDSGAGTFEWSIDKLPAGQSGKIAFAFNVGGVEVGQDTLSSSLHTIYSNNDGIAETHRDTAEFQQILNCRPPVNAMQVNPMGIGEPHFSKKNQEFQYLIHFQKPDIDFKGNTRVMVKVGGQVDLESINIAGSSHPMYATFEEGNLVFHLNEMEQGEKPQGNFPESGHILYGISPENEVTDSTTLHNKAQIFYGTNTVVETNEVFNTLVEKIPAVVKEITSLKNYHPNEGLKIYPNPAREKIFIEWKNGSLSNKSYYLINKLGQKVRSLQSSDDIVELHIKSLPKGIYFLSIIGDKGSVNSKVVLE